MNKENTGIDIIKLWNEKYPVYNSVLKSIKNDDEYDYIPCNCPCHNDNSVIHFIPCCDNGFIKIKKVKDDNN